MHKVIIQYVERFGTSKRGVRVGVEGREGGDGLKYNMIIVAYIVYQ